MGIQTFLVDVYLIREDGRDVHLGGGYYKASSQTEAERMAAREHASYLHENSPQLGFLVDISDMNRPTLIANASEAHAISEASGLTDSETKLPF